MRSGNVPNTTISPVARRKQMEHNCTYETSLSLHKAGILIDADDSYVKIDKANKTKPGTVRKTRLVSYLMESTQMTPTPETWEVLPAPTFSEVWALLPRSVKIRDSDYMLNMGKYEGGNTWIGYRFYHVKYEQTYTSALFEDVCQHRLPVEAACQLLAQLVEHGLAFPNAYPVASSLPCYGTEPYIPVTR